LIQEKVLSSQKKKECVIKSTMASYVLNLAKSFVYNNIDELTKRSLQNSEEFVTEKQKEYVNEKVKMLLEKTADLEPIPRYFIIDAVLSNRFNITLAEARYAWDKELEFAKKIVGDIQPLKNIPKVYRCARFVLAMLKHLMQRGLTQTVVSYQHVADNFIVGLTRTYQCVCSSYSLYIQAMVDYFDYSDYISDCIVTGHTFTVTNSYGQKPGKNVFVLGFDAGFFANNWLLVRSWGSHGTYSIETVKKMINWDPTFFGLVQEKQFPNCIQTHYWGRDKNTTNSHVAGNLWLRTFTKKTMMKMIRNQYIVLHLVQDLEDSNLYYATVFAKHQLHSEIVELEVLRKFFVLPTYKTKITDGTPLYKETSLVERLQDYDENVVRMQKSVRKLLGNANLNMSPYIVADRELHCMRALIYYFRSYIKKWSIEEFQVLRIIQKHFASLLKNHAIVAEELITTYPKSFRYIYDFYINRSVQINFAVTLDNRKDDEFPLFNFYAVERGDLKYLKYVKKGSCIYLSSIYKTAQYFDYFTPKHFISKGIKLIFLPSMTKNIVIVTYDYPERDQDYVDFILQKKTEETELLQRIDEIKRGTFKKYLKPENIQTRMKSIERKVDDLSLLPPQTLSSLKSRQYAVRGFSISGEKEDQDEQEQKQPKTPKHHKTTSHKKPKHGYNLRSSSGLG
jgi:hypothetical protein